MELDFSARLRQTLDQIQSGKRYDVTETEVTATSEAETISLTSVKWSDPRQEDFPADSKEWERLMALVEHTPELHSMLNTIRGVGANLVPGKTSYLLRPVIDPTGNKGWATEAEYNDMKKHLKSYQGTIEGALMQLHKRCAVR